MASCSAPEPEHAMFWLLGARCWASSTAGRCAHPCRPPPNQLPRCPSCCCPLPLPQVVKSAANYSAAAREEVALLHRIRDADPLGLQHCVRLLDSFEHDGVHGRHVCEVFEAMGDDLLALIRWVGGCRRAGG